MLIMNNIAKNQEANLVPTIKKIVEVIKYYFNLNLDDEKWENIFKILFDVVSETNNFVKTNNLLQKSKDTYKTLSETVLFFFKTFGEYFNKLEKQ